MKTRKPKNIELLPEDRRSFINRLEICAEKAGNIANLARMSGVSAPVIASYLSGKSDPSRERTIAIAQAVKLSPSWLTTGEGQPEPIISRESIRAEARTIQSGAASPVRDDFVEVPLFNVVASAGHGGAVVDESAEDFIRFSSSMLRKFGVAPGELFITPALGDSMEPRIRSGELMLCSKAPHHLKGSDGTYVTRLEGDILVKRVQRLPGGRVVVSSENPAYTPFEVVLSDGVDFAIIGLVLLTFRRV